MTDAEVYTQKVLLGIVSGPVWEDGCHHKCEDYICSFEWYDDRQKKNLVADLYVFEDHYFGSSVCIRHSSEPSDYTSPGPPHHLQGVDIPFYERAWDILRSLGTFHWKRKEDNNG